MDRPRNFVVRWVTDFHTRSYAVEALESVRCLGRFHVALLREYTDSPELSVLHSARFHSASCVRNTHSHTQYMQTVQTVQYRLYFEQAHNYRFTKFTVLFRSKVRKCAWIQVAKMNESAHINPAAHFFR